MNQDVLVFLSATDHAGFFDLPHGYYMVPYGWQGMYEIVGEYAREHYGEMILVSKLIEQIKNAVQ